MKISVAKLKSLLILFLGMMAIYQTGRLWFEDDLSRNLFYSYLNAGGNYGEMEEGYSFALPYRILANFGNNKFNIQYADIRNLKARTVVDQVISETFRNGEYVLSAPIDYNDLLSARSLIYEYKFAMDSELFTKIFSQRANMFTSQVDTFDMVIAAADNDVSNILNVYFLDTKSQMAHWYVVDNIALCDELRDELQEIQRKSQNEGMYYVSSKLLKINTDFNFFFPRWEGERADYHTIVIKTTYFDNWDMTLSSIKEGISWLFDNPDSIMENEIDEVLTFSDSNTVVKYNGNDVLEYRNYKTNKNKKDSTLLEDYSKAVGFINQDLKMVQMVDDFYLAGYEQQGSTRLFYFDYVVNNYPIVFFDAFSEKNVDHAMTVEVVNGMVKGYTKLSYYYEVNTDTVETGSDIVLDIIDSINNETISDVNFGYKATLAKANSIDANTVNEVFLYAIIAVNSEGITNDYVVVMK